MDNTIAAHVAGAISSTSVIPGGRLTLSSGVAVTTADVTAVTVLRYTPYVHNLITLWTGMEWLPVAFKELSYDTAGFTANNYDIFAKLNSAGIAAIETPIGWSSATTVRLGPGPDGWPLHESD